MVRKPSTHLPSAPLLNQLSLRDYQRKAVRDVRCYIANFRKDTTSGAALVQMPTGAGKSGIIATLARCLPGREVGCVLILAPRIALREQLTLDLRGRFFNALDKSPTPGDLPKTIIELSGTIPSVRPSDYTRHIFVSTIQMLVAMRKAAEKNTGPQAKLYLRLKKHTTLLIVDEGHYEPAVSWGRSIRDIRAPKVLFTATPYRNDLKTFDVDLGYWSCYTYKEASRDAYLREIKFEQRPPTNDPHVFIDDILAYYNKNLADTSARVIIRCDDRPSIEHMATVLRDRGRTLVGIHEDFRDNAGPEWQRRSVPRQDREARYFSENGPVFWIHQFKLLEGIDHSQFRLLALFDPLRNTRALVQQIGRLVRNPEYPHKATAYVLDHTGGEHERRWNAFLEHDKRLKEYDKGLEARQKRSSADESRNKHHPLKGVSEEEFLEDVMRAHPDPAYIDGTFRRRLDIPNLRQLRPREELRLPLTLNLFEKKSTFVLKDFCEAIAQMLREDDRWFERYNHEAPNTVVFIYFSLKNAPFLSSTYFLECSPGVIVIHELERLLAFYDSGGYVPRGLGYLGVGRPPKPPRMNRVFHRREESRVVRLALKNANLGHRAIRWRTFAAASVRETVPALDDYGQVVSTVVGYSAEDVLASDRMQHPLRYTLRRRYVGFARGRITEAAETKKMDDYLGWVQEVADVIEGRRKSLAVFDRYAREEVHVPDKAPRNVLLDMFEVQNDFLTVANETLGIRGGEALEIDDLCKDVIESLDSPEEERFSFSVQANGQPCTVFVFYDNKRERYKLRSQDLDRMYYRGKGATKQKLVAYLNEEQSFCVLPKSPDVVYIDGSFYRVSLPIGRRFRKDAYHVGGILRTSDILKGITLEKGEKCLSDGSDWDANSLFGIISRLGKGYGDLEKDFGDPDLVVCDDMGTEVADFIIADAKTRRVVFIHAKGLGKNENRKKYSASKLADVCAQAMKNIHYLSMFNEYRPKKLTSWTDPWTTNHVEGLVKERIRRFNGKKDPLEVWSEFQARIANPLTRREVWLFLGGILSRKELETNLRKQTPEAVQAIMQLQGTLAAVGSIEAKLRVFCYP